MIADAHLLQMRERVEDVGIVGSRLANGRTDDFGRLLDAERAGILHMLTVDHITHRPRLPPIAEQHGQHLFLVNIGNKLAASQVIEDILPIFPAYPESDAAAGAATIKTEHQTRLFRRTAMHIRPYTEGTAKAEGTCGQSFLKRKTRIPHQGPVAKHPKFVHIARNTNSIKQTGLSFSAPLENIMAASSRTGVSGKLWLLACGVVLVIALYTAGWFYAASALRERTLTLLGSQERNGVSAECSDAEYRGYPFRIGLFCSKVAIDDRVNGISATFGALRSAAQVYNPGHIVWELDSPVEARTGHGLTVSTTWENFQSSLITRLRGVERTSTVIENAKTSVVSSSTGQAFDISASHTEIHLRQNGSDLDAAMTLEGTDLMMKDMPQLLPRLTANVDVTLNGRAGMIDGSDPNGLVLYGTQGEMRSLSADLGQGRLITVSGPFSFDEQGYLSGKLRLRIEQIDAWRNSLGEAFPEIASTLETVSRMLSALGGGRNASLDLTITRGKVFAGGFIPIGEIPPI